MNISGLPAGEYSVTVFDQKEDYVDNNPAFEHDEFFYILRHDHPISIIDNHQRSTITVPSFTSGISGLCQNNIVREYDCTPYVGIV